jgi:GlpG protein
MRQLATLSDSFMAHTLADYLLTLRIETKLDQQPDGWIVWVRDEDHLARARQELDEFTRNPHDSRYMAASSEADELRRRKTQEEKAYHKRQDRFSRRMSGSIASEKWTVGLIVLCGLVSLVSAGGTSRGIVQALSISTTRFTELGPSSPSLWPILHGEVWRLVTPIFLHFGIWHLVFDMYMLYILGGAVERSRGPLRYLILVLVLAVLSNLAQYYLAHPRWDEEGIKLYLSPNFGGMSGVVYGLFGYIWMKARFQPELGLLIPPSTVIYLMAWFFLCMTPLIHFITESGIANGAHAGGLIAGILIGYASVVWHSFGSD